MNIVAYVYCTVNVSCRFDDLHTRMYIGVHKHNGFDKDYKGSGSLISEAFSEYGRDNFKTYMMKAFDNYEDALNYERYVIIKFGAFGYNNPMYYNISIGGELFTTPYTWMYNPDTGKRIHAPKEEVVKLSSEGYVKGYPHVTWMVRDGERILVEPEDLSRVYSEGYHNVCSTEGYVWLNDGTNNIYVRAEEIPDIMDEGVSYGMINGGPRGYVWVHRITESGIDRKFIHESELESALDEGYIRGSAANPHEGKKMVNDGTIEFYVPEDEFDSYLARGLKSGHIKSAVMTNGYDTIEVSYEDRPYYQSLGYVSLEKEYHKSRGRIGITNGKKNHKIDPEDLPEWEAKGFWVGLTQKFNSFRGWLWYTNGIDNKRVGPDGDPQPLIDRGYTRGRMPRQRIEENKKFLYENLREFLELPDESGQSEAKTEDDN